MDSIRKFTFSDRNTQESLTIQISEQSTDSRYGMFLWPSAPVLSQFIFHQRHLFRNKRIIELGAGTALPSIVAAKVGAQVIITDTHQNPDCLALCKRNLTLNDLPFNSNDDCVTVFPLTWGLITQEVINLKPFDYIIASDCFYDLSDFEDIFATVSFLIEKSENNSAVFFTTYQERNADWNIECLLKKWQLKCECIKLSEFDGDKANVAGSDLTNNHSISLFKIMK